MKQTVSETPGCAGCLLREQFPQNTFVKPLIRPGSRCGIGEFPQVADAESGVPFSGGDGRWVEVLYKNAGTKKENVSLFNIIQCVPPTTTNSVGKEVLEFPKTPGVALHCMKAHVQPLLDAHKWQRIDLFGEAALRYVAIKNGIDMWRGTPLPVPSLGPELRTVPTFSPGRLATEQAMLPVALEDLKKGLYREKEEYNVYPSLDAVKAFDATHFAFDIETSRKDFGKIFMVGLSSRLGECIVVPFNEPYVGELKRIFANAKSIVGQNLIQFDLPMLALNGVHVRGPKECMVWDIMLMQHLRFPSFPHDLDFIGKQFTNKGHWKSDKASFETYCARDTDVTFRCFEPLHKLLVDADLLDVYKYVSWPLARICAHMTKRGFQRSTSRVLELREKYLGEIAAMQPELPDHIRSQFVTRRRRIEAPPGTLGKSGKPVKYVHEEFQLEIHPWKSSDVKKKYLYEELGLPTQYHLVKRTTVTADKGALERLYNRLNNPSKDLLAERGQEWIDHRKRQVKIIRELSTRATRLSGFAKESVADDVIHPSFNVHGTETGRFSSSDPNAQNIPEEARFMFVPRVKGGRLVAMDYSGIENRITAYLAGDRARMERFADPTFSEHKFLAGRLEGIPYEQVVKSKDRDSWYMVAKAAVHGSDRMMGAKKMWEKNDLDPDLVKNGLAMWKELIAGTIKWQKKVGEECKKGWVRNVFKRMLWFWETNAVTRAVSFYPQSTAFDVIARAMIGLMYEKIDWPKDWAEKVCPIVVPLPQGADLNLQVHDELVCECDTEELVEPTVKAMHKVMTQPWPELDGLSLPVGIGIGESWGECG